MMKEIQGQYDPNPFIEPILAQMRSDEEESARKQKEREEQAHTLEAEALIGFLG